MPFDGELDNPPLDPDHKPRTGLSFFFNQGISLGKGNMQAISNKETVTCKDFTMNYLYHIEEINHPLE